MRKLVFRLLLTTALCAGLIGGLWIASPPRTEARGSSWTVTVFSDPNLGSPIWTGIVPTVSFTWGVGAPIINGVSTTGSQTDYFSIRFTTSAFFTAGNYRFTTQVDDNDGVRLSVDGLPVINQWTPGAGFRTFQGDLNFTADGNHTISVEMWDAGGNAAIVANWSLAVGGLPTPTIVCTTGSPWFAEFFNGLDLAGGVLYTTTFGPSGLNQAWPQSPGGPVPVDNWSARFTRSVNVPAEIPQGVYTFYAFADDNFRFTVDTTVIFDKWSSWGGDVQTAEVTLLNGGHTFKFEFREISVDAKIFLTWSPASGQCPPLAPPGGGVPGGGGGGVPTGITATVNTSVLNFRSAPSTTASVLSQLTRGQQYPATGRTGDNQWVQLSVGGVTGWVVAQYLTLSGDINALPVVSGGGTSAPPPPQPTGVRGKTYGNLRIRSAPTTRSTQVGLMPWGTEMDLLGKDGGHTWYQVSYNGVTGWAYAPWIRIITGTFDQLPYTDGTQPAITPPQATQGVVVEAQGNMRIRSGPGFQYPKIARAVWGTRMQVLARSTNLLWYKVQYGSITGWTYGAWYRVVQGEITSVPTSDQ